MATEQTHTRLPWKWDGDELWHFGESYCSDTDPHRYTGITADIRLRDSPALRANKALILAALNALAHEKGA